MPTVFSTDDSRATTGRRGRGSGSATTTTTRRTATATKRTKLLPFFKRNESFARSRGAAMAPQHTQTGQNSTNFGRDEFHSRVCPATHQGTLIKKLRTCKVKIYQKMPTGKCGSKNSSFRSTLDYNEEKLTIGQPTINTVAERDLVIKT